MSGYIRFMKITKLEYGNKLNTVKLTAMFKSDKLLSKHKS
jgi:hypothetical protein